MEKTVVHCTTIKPNTLHFRDERRSTRVLRAWSAEPQSLRRKLPEEGVLSCRTSHRKARIRRAMPSGGVIAQMPCTCIIHCMNRDAVGSSQ